MTPREYLESALDALGERCLISQVHYRIWARFGTTWAKNHHARNRHPNFWGWTELAHYNAFISNLYRLLRPSKRAIHLPHVIAYARKYPEIFNNKNQRAVATALDKAEGILSSNKSLIDNLLNQRDLYFAHLSSDHMQTGFDSVFRQFPASHKDLYRLARAIGKAINLIELPLRNLTHIWLQEKESDTRRFLEELKQ